MKNRNATNQAGQYNYPFTNKSAKDLRNYLMNLFETCSNNYVVQSMNHTSLGSKFYAKLISAITPRRAKLWWRTAHQSKVLDDIYNLTVSKRDLKPSGMSYSGILHATSDSQVPMFLGFLPPEGDSGMQLTKINYVYIEFKITNKVIVE